MKRDWSKRELDLLRTRYGILGPKGVARILGRSYHSVRHKAHRKKIAVGHVKGWLLASEVDALAGVHPGEAVEAARREGQKVRMVAGRAIVREEWGEEYIERQLRAAEADELLEHGYYDTAKAARILEVSDTCLRSWCRGDTEYGRTEFREKVSFFQASGRFSNTYVFNPYDIEALAKERRNG